MIRSVQVKDAGQIRDLCHQALGYDSTLEKVAGQIEKFNLPDSGHF
ncbi:GNAT family N-acetyltransferase, partial [Escherichia coli]|nr:GNAT family N-acetyltransferase [Escherichia coli]